MQHDHVLKKLNFDLMIQPQGQGMGLVGSAGKVFATKLLHFVIDSLLFYMKHLVLQQCGKK